MIGDLEQAELPLDIEEVSGAQPRASEDLRTVDCRGYRPSGADLDSLGHLDSGALNLVEAVAELQVDLSAAAWTPKVDRRKVGCVRRCNSAIFWTPTSTVGFSVATSHLRGQVNRVAGSRSAR